MFNLKKFMALLLCAVMVLCSFPAVSATETTEPETVKPWVTDTDDPTQVYCPHCDTVPAWTVWNGKKPANGAHVYLPEGGVTMTAAITLNTENVVVNLNGQTLTNNYQGKLFLLNPGSKLTLMDSSPEGTGTVLGAGKAANHGGIIMAYGGDLDVFGGTYRLKEESNSTNKGGIFYTLTQEVNGTSKRTKANITGATIYGANATDGGAISNAGATLVLTDCTIYAGTANRGDSIYISTAASNVTFAGDNVIHGGVQINNAGSVTIFGKPVIMKEEGGSAYSMKLDRELSLTLGELEEGTRIGISGAGQIAYNLETPDAARRLAKCFVSEDSDKHVATKGTRVMMVENEVPTDTKCPHCNKVPSWQPWDGAANHASGHFYLTEDTAFTAESNSVSGTKNVVINLNGYTLESTKKFGTVSAKLAFVDTSAEGTGSLAGYGRTGSHAGIAQANGGTIEFYSGNFYLKDDAHAAKNGGLVLCNSGGTVNVKGGEFWGADAENGGVFCVTGGTLNISGGTLHAGTASNAGDTLIISGASASMNITGSPVIEGGVHIGENQSVSISGSPVIRKVPGGSACSMKCTSTLPSFGTLSQGAHIRVNADGIFTADFENVEAAKAAKEYLHCDDVTKGVKVEGLALTVAESDDPADFAGHPSKDDELNILLIGNSYSYYWPDELWGLMNAAGYENVTICNVYYSGCYFERHWNWYLEGAANYQFWINDSSGRWVKKDYDLVSCLEYKNWDMISFQQSGRYIYGAKDPMSNHRNNIEPWLGNLYDLTMQDFPYADYYWHQSWTHEIGNGVKDLEEQLYMGTVQRTIALEVCEKYGFTRVPCTDSWELVRHDPLIKADGKTLTYRTGNDPDTEEKEVYFDDLTHDGDIGGGQYLNACTWFEVITGKSVVGNTFAPVYKASDGTTHELGAEKIALLQNAAHTAVQAVYGQPDEEEPTAPESIRGDMNNDGSVSDADAMYLLRYTLFGEGRYPLPQSGDVNGDGSVSDADAMYLLRYTLFGESRYPLY